MQVVASNGIDIYIHSEYMTLLKSFFCNKEIDKNERKTKTEKQILKE